MHITSAMFALFCTSSFMDAFWKDVKTQGPQAATEFHFCGCCGYIVQSDKFEAIVRFTPAPADAAKG